jgi:hypothetical protein
VEALRQDLALATGALRSDRIRDDFRESVGVLFGGFFQRKMKDLETLSRTLGEDRGVVEPGALVDYWKGLERHAEECDRILKEYLAFVEGALVRSAKLDDGICDIADAFLRKIAHDTDIEWPRFTIFAEDEFFAPLTDIIRLRYPHFSVWNLPVLAHEFGHFATPKLKDRIRGVSPLNDLRRQLEREAVQGLPQAAQEEAVQAFRLQLAEFIADAFAVHTVGPAFVHACVHLRFEPAHAHEERGGYPTEARRAQVLFRMLDGMDPAYAKVTAALRSRWQGSLTAAGAGGPAADPWLDALADRLRTTFEDVVPAARFGVDHWRQAADLGLRLLNADWESGAGALGLGEVLNAAWLCRLREGEQATPTISARALYLCRKAG